MVMCLGVESCDWFALSVLCLHLTSSLHSNTPSSLITTYLLFILFINVILFPSAVCLLSFPLFVLFPHPFLTSCSGPIRGGSLSLPFCPSLDVPPPPPVPPRSRSHSRGSRCSRSSIILNQASAKRQLLPFRLPNASPFANPSKHSPHRPPCFIISPLPRTLSAGTRAAGGMGIERGHSRGCGVPTRGGGGGTALTVFQPLRKSRWHMTRAGWHNSCPHCSQANIQPISMMCHLHETFARPLTMIVMSVWA